MEYILRLHLLVYSLNLNQSYLYNHRYMYKNYLSLA
jgi:hypothetical protein